MIDKKTEFTREEDYRDFEARDLKEGWPYSDEAGAVAPDVGNGPYGKAEADFDRERNEGYRVTEVEADGFQPKLKNSVLPETDRRENSDQVESEVNAALEEIREIDLMGVDIHVDRHVVTLRGAVDTAEERRKIELVALGAKGVEEVRNLINTRGIDTHIPQDND